MQTANETPFPYQVAGHGALLKLQGGKICKPLIERELSFYESLKKTFSTLQPFTASYYGTLELSITKDKLNKWNAKVEEAEKDENGKGSFEDEHLIPWSAHVTKLSVSKLENSNNNSFSILKKKRCFFFFCSLSLFIFFLTYFEYLVLEDLTRNFQKPCVLDIKIGTRQHGDDVPADKKKRHMHKVASTTSKPLGMRICGQLVYENTSKSYRHFDKYQGRKLTQDTIQHQIAQFFNNGTYFRLDLLKKFINKLTEFQIAVQKESRYRFYSTSLLLLYEGEFDDAPKAKDTLVDVRMIDFAHTYTLSKEEVQDDGYLFGLQNFITILQNISKEIYDKSSPLTERLRIIDA